jgi:hypothetical protein
VLAVVAEDGQQIITRLLLSELARLEQLQRSVGVGLPPDGQPERGELERGTQMLAHQLETNPHGFVVQQFKWFIRQMPIE